MTPAEQQIKHLWGYARLAIDRGALSNELQRFALIMLLAEMGDLDVHARLGGTVQHLQGWLFGFDPQHQPS